MSDQKAKLQQVWDEATQLIERLIAERDAATSREAALRAELAQRIGGAVPQSEWEQLVAKEAALREALHKYGDHFPECSVIQECGKAVKPPCNCGFSQALAGKGEK